MKIRAPWLLIVLAACGGDDGKNGKTTLLQTSNEPPGANCLNGGTKVTSGIDADGNGTLDDSEVTSTSYICGTKNAATCTLQPFGSCTNADLRGISISGTFINLQGIDLSGSDLRGATISNVSLISANLQNTKLDRADFAGSTLDSANLDRRDSDAQHSARLHTRIDHHCWRRLHRQRVLEHRSGRGACRRNKVYRAHRSRPVSRHVRGWRLHRCRLHERYSLRLGQCAPASSAGRTKEPLELIAPIAADLRGGNFTNVRTSLRADLTRTNWGSLPNITVTGAKLRFRHGLRRESRG